MSEDLRSLYPTARWRRARAAFLRLHPVCSWPACGQRSTVVDHIVPRSRGGSTWDRTNWQALCKPHHDEKTRREQGHGQVSRRPRHQPVDSIEPSGVVTRDYSRGVPA